MISTKILLQLSALLLFGVLTTARFSQDNLGLAGGTEAKDGEFPYQVSIQSCRNGVCSHICGGAIIDLNWIVTAAGCALNASKVVVGHANLGDNVTLLDIERKIAHKDYDNSTGIGPNDIGLVKLAKDLYFDDYVNPVLFPDPNNTLSGAATVSGYGTSNNKLNYVTDLKLVSYEECKDAVKNITKEDRDCLDKSGNLCTLNKESNICVGDRGGPLIQDGVFIGVVSWNFQCGTKNAPNIYTNVTYFYDWILTNI